MCGNGDQGTADPPAAQGIPVCPPTLRPASTSKRSPLPRRCCRRRRPPIAAFVGFTERAPMDDPNDPEGLAPRLVTSWSQFEQLYGCFAPGCVLPLSVYGYFQNGGSIAYICRIPNTEPAGEPSRLALPAADRALGQPLVVKSVEPDASSPSRSRPTSRATTTSRRPRAVRPHGARRRRAGRDLPTTSPSTAATATRRRSSTRRRPGSRSTVDLDSGVDLVLPARACSSPAATRWRRPRPCRCRSAAASSPAPRPPAAASTASPSPRT